jgi:hypothetical protein
MPAAHTALIQQHGQSSHSQFYRSLQHLFKRHALALLLLLLPLVILFAPVARTGYTLLPVDQMNTMFLPYSAHYSRVEAYNHFLTDAWAQVYPYKVRQRNNLLRGEIVSWNPSILGGHPHYASTSFTHFDPTNIVLLVFDMPTAYHGQMFLKLAIAGVGMYVLLATLGCSPLICSLFGSAYMMNSLFITTLQHQWIVGSLCWMPLCLAALRVVLLRRTSGHGMLSASIVTPLCAASVALALAFLGGSIQTSALCALIVVLASVSSTIGFVRFAQAVQPDTTLKTQQGRGQFFLRSLGMAVSVSFVIGVLAFALSAFMWLPSIELFLENVNPRTGGKEFSLLNGLKALPLLASFAMPELLGNVRGFDIAKLAGADMHDFNGSAGFVPWMLGIVGCCMLLALWSARRRHRRHSHRTELDNSQQYEQLTQYEQDVLPFVVLIVCGIVLPLFTPVYKFLYHRCFLMYILGLCVCGALTLQMMLVHISPTSPRRKDEQEIAAQAENHAENQEQPKQQNNDDFLFFARLLTRIVDYWRSLLAKALLAGTALLTVASVGLVWQWERIEHALHNVVMQQMNTGQLATGNQEWMLGRVDVFLRHFLLWSPTMWLPLVLIAGSLSLLAAWRRGRCGAATLLVGLIALNASQTLFFAFSWLPIVNTKRYPLFPATETLRFLQRDSTAFRVLPLWDDKSQRVFQPNTLDMYGIDLIQGYESLFPPNVSMLAVSIGEHPTTQQLRVAGLIGVKYYATSNAMTLLHPALEHVDVTPSGNALLAEKGKTRLWRNKFWQGRAWIAHQYKVIPRKEDQIHFMLDSSSMFDGSTVLLFNEPKPAEKPVDMNHSRDASVTDDHGTAHNNQREAQNTEIDKVLITHAENNRVRLKVHSARAGWCVLADTWYPGWRVFVNSQERTVERANGMLRAVAVPAGPSVVEFRFEPVLPRIGAWISVGTAMLVSIMLLLSLASKALKKRTA